MSTDDPQVAPAGADDYPDLRTLSDARTLRALAHPVRIALLETLTLGGAMTATEVGERIGESPTTCSFHLRQLAKYHFVEEAGGGKGRARPWKISSVGLRWGTSTGDPEVDLAASAVARLFRDRQLERYRTFRESSASYPQKWRTAASDSEYLFHLTAEELVELNDQLHAILLAFHRDRLVDPSSRPAGAVPVELLLFTYPIELPTEEGNS